MKRLVSVLGMLAIGVLLVVVPQAAQAAGNGPAAHSAASPMSSCPVTRYNYTGYEVCEFYNGDSVNYGNGNIEYFVVGTNYQIYHIWKGSGGWHSLGGVARKATPNGVAVLSTNPTVITTIGTNNYYYCNSRGTGTWSGWFYCD
jgi:hypothetical protein